MLLQLSIHQCCSLPLAIWQNWNFVFCNTATYLQLSCSVTTYYFALLQLVYRDLPVLQLTFFEYCNLPIAILKYYSFVFCTAATYIQLSCSAITIFQYCDSLFCSTATHLDLCFSIPTYHLAVLQLSYSYPCGTATYLPLSCSSVTYYLAVLQFTILRYCNLPIAILQYCNILSCINATYL